MGCGSSLPKESDPGHIGLAPSQRASFKAKAQLNK